VRIIDNYEILRTKINFLGSEGYGRFEMPPSPPNTQPAPNALCVRGDRVNIILLAETLQKPNLTKVHEDIAFPYWVFQTAVELCHLPGYVVHQLTVTNTAVSSTL
jgi:hypothetical protein